MQLPPYSKNWALFLDVDGTLVQLAEHPLAVEVRSELRDLLQQLIEMTEGALALISGRSLADLDRLFAPLQLPAAGLHGNQRRDASGGLHEPAIAAEQLALARRQAERFAVRYPGCHVEDKGNAFALHFRQVPAAAAGVAALMQALLDELNDDYVLQRGKMVMELRPAAHDKGSAILAFLQEPPFSGRLPVFIGDDVSDEDGFRRVSELGGVAIKVGEGESAAPWRLADSQAVADWLQSYCDFCTKDG